MIGHLIRPELEELIAAKRWDVLREAFSEFDPSDIAEILSDLPNEDDLPVFRVLPRDLAGEVFSRLPAPQQDELLQSLSGEQTRALLSEMPPDDQARLLEELPAEVTRRLLAELSPVELREARDLLGYPPETAGRYMTPAYIALQPEMTAAEALEFVRTTGRDKETVNVLFVVDREGRLLSEMELGQLVMAEPLTRLADVDANPTISITATADRESAQHAFEKYGRIALPVVDDRDRLLGMITIDDILDVAAQEATEDIQKLGGLEALDAPYLEVSFPEMLRKRGSWLSVLFLGEMLTATAMGYFEDEIARAVVLALFVPLIISSGGDSGSQAATLIVRSLAIGEVRLRDWLRVLRRELATSLTLGAWLGMIGFVRVVVWHKSGWIDYGPYYMLVGSTVWITLIGVVCFGSVTGSMLPFVLRRLGFDPATSSAPFVATLVDVTGLVIYFTVAMFMLRGTLL